MSGELFAPWPELVTGALTGFVFGFLLQKGGVTRYATIVGQFLMKDFTVLKVMLTAIVVGGIGIYGMRAMGLEVALHVKGTQLLANAGGGVVFGAGMALLGYCPGTGVAAIGDGSRDAAVGVLGMLFGSWLFALAFPWLKANVMPVGDLGKETFATLGDTSPFVFLVPLGIVLLALVIVDRRPPRERSVEPLAGPAAP